MIDRARTLGAVTRNLVVCAIGSAGRLHRAHGDDIWIIAGSSDRPITLGVLAVVTTVVTGRSYYNNACLPCFFGCLAKRINRVTLEDRTSQREIDYANVVLRFQPDRGLDGGDDAAVGA